MHNNEKTTDRFLIHLNGLKSWYSIKKFGEERGYSEWLKSYTEPQWVGWLIALLQQETDTEKLFPYGKWATIQTIQDLLSMAAKNECESFRQSEN